ncbi:MAG TPA: rhomboid family intramembrane serine protease [Geobacteraceae bacterium]|nr:rhomboid family intramembrane serine protease [Geobacteraceae bacterium]
MLRIVRLIEERIELMGKRAMLCPRCRRIIGSNETVCSWCGTSRSNPWWKAMAWSRGSLGDDWLVQAVIVVNIVFFVLSLLLTRHHSLTLNPLALLAPDQTSLLLLGATGTIPIDEFGRFWSLLSANYLHGGILHIVFNLMAFRQITPWVSQEYGDSRMFAIYTLGGIGGYLLSYLAGIPFTIGASAALCALIGSLLYYGKSRGGTYGAMVYREVSGWVVGLILFGLIFPGINNWAHSGGLISGIILGKLLGYGERKRETPIHRYLAMACGIATIGCLAWGTLGALAFRFVH